MLRLFSKSANELTAEDVAKLVSEALPEGQHVEYKEALPSTRQTGDPWLQGAGSIGEKARNEILAEVIAFANADGGNLVLGMEETADHPKRAKGVKPLPRCHDLAGRLRHVARDCVEPQLPSVEIYGVETGKRPKGTGVVLIRVPPSRLGPHRLTTNSECYIRRADRTEKMTMREIQDLTIQLARGLEAVEKKLMDRQSQLSKLPPPGTSQTALGMRVTALPIGGHVYIPQPYRSPALSHLYESLSATIDTQAVELLLPGFRLASKPFTPILRGAHRDIVSGHVRVAEEIHCDGLVELACRASVDPKDGALIYLGHPLSMVANVLLVAQRIRELSGVPRAELVLDVEISHDQMPGSVSTPEPPKLCSFGGLTSIGVLGPLNPIPLRLPLRSVSTSEEFSSIVKDVLDDLLNATGHDARDDFEIDLPPNDVTA